MGRSSKQAQGFSATMTGTGRSVVRSLAAITGATLGIVGVTRGLQSLVRSAADFESTFAGIRKTVEATEPQFTRLAAGMRKLSKEIPVNVNELNRIGEAAGQLGIRTENILGFTRVMADLGVTTNLASDEAATALARLANITQLPQSQFDRLGSTIVDLGNNLATTEKEIVEMGLRLSGAGKQVGISEARILGMAAALSSVGIAAEAGGTAVSTALVKIAKETQSGGQKLELLGEVAGMTGAEFAAAFERDAAGAFAAFAAGLERMRKAGGNVFETLDKLGLGNVRMRDALLRTAGAGDLMRKSLGLADKAWRSNTALTKEAEQRYNTFESRLQKFRNIVNDLQITLGDLLLPEILKVTDAGGKWLSDTRNQERVQAAFRQSIDAVSAAIRGLVPWVQRAVGLIRGFSNAVGGARNAVVLLGAAFLALKIPALTAALGSSVVAIRSVVAALTSPAGLVAAAGVSSFALTTLALRATDLDDRLFNLGRTIADVAEKLGLLESAEEAVAAAQARAEQSRTRSRIETIVGSTGRTGMDLFFPFKAPLVKGQFRDVRLALAAEALAAGRDAGGKAASGFRLGLESGVLELRKSLPAKVRGAFESIFDVRTLIPPNVAGRARIERFAGAIQRMQFRALGLTSAGEDLAPTREALTEQLRKITGSLKGTLLDTDANQNLLARVRKVLALQFGALTRDTRLKIQELLRAFDALDEGQEKRTRFRRTSTARFVEALGLGLDANQTRRLRMGLAQLGPGMTVPSGSAAFAGAGGGGMVVHGDLVLQGVQNVTQFENEISRRNKSRPQVRRGQALN